MEPPHQSQTQLNLTREGVAWGLVQQRLDYLRDLKIGVEEWAENAGTMSLSMSHYYDATRPPEHFAPQEQSSSSQGSSPAGHAASYAGGVPTTASIPSTSIINQGSSGEYLLPN
eukprot:2284821-Heterocapsa_arctica.AAC.1